MGGSPGSLAVASRWREVASPVAHCAERLVPAPGKKGQRARGLTSVGGQGRGWGVGV